MRYVSRAWVVLLGSMLLGCGRQPDHEPVESKVPELLAERRIERLEKELNEAREQLADTRRQLRAVRKRVLELSGPKRGGIEITILGRVTNPGTYAFAEPVTALQLFGHAGGLRDDADLTRVRVRRPGTEQAREWDCSNLLLRGDGKNPEITDGYVLLVPQRQDDAAGLPE